MTAMKGENPPATLPPTAVCHRCREETARYRRGEPFDDRYCFDVMRRAIVERDETCWQALHEIYHAQVLSWCRRAGAGFAADPDELVSMTWEKFWLNYTPHKLAAASGSSAGVLSYLKLCAHSVVIDANRARGANLSLDEARIEKADTDPTPAEAQAGRDARARFWEIVNALLKDERERMLMYLTYELDLKSAEIQTRRPDLYPSVNDVYRLTRNVHDRLARSNELRAWRALEGG